MAPDSTVFGWPDSSEVARAGIATARAERDWTVKVDVTGLSHGVRYWYAFDVVDASGPGSKTRASVPPTCERREATLERSNFPRPRASRTRETTARCAPRCSRAPTGRGGTSTPTTPRRGGGAARTSQTQSYTPTTSPRIHAWFHLGDYYYEYGRTHYPNADEAVPERWRSLDPPAETVTLDEYRRRHRLYRSDPGLRKLHAASARRRHVGRPRDRE